MISATDKMADIAKVLRLGVQDVLLKPLTDLNRLREAVLACLYPNMFTSQAIEEVELFQDWDALVRNPLPLPPNCLNNCNRRYSRPLHIAGSTIGS